MYSMWYSKTRFIFEETRLNISLTKYTKKKLFSRNLEFFFSMNILVVLNHFNSHLLWLLLHSNRKFRKQNNLFLTAISNNIICPYNNLFPSTEERWDTEQAPYIMRAPGEDSLSVHKAVLTLTVVHRSAP